MSLVSFIKNPDVRDRFKKEFQTPNFNLRAQILCPPITTNYGLVGTAFDYLLRFYLKRVYPQAIDNRWVAEEAVEITSSVPAFFEMANLMLTESKKVYKEYLKTGKMTDELKKASIFLAQLDFIYRSGEIYQNFGEIDDNDVVDLTNLILCVKPELFKPKNRLLLNPAFGKSSQMVGGADADIIVDDMLIDIKTTKNLELKISDFHQLIGYYMLSRLGKINDEYDLDLKTLAIYFSRHGVLYSIPIDIIFKNTNMDKFLIWFENKAKEHYPE